MKTWIALGVTLLATTASFAGYKDVATQDPVHDGLFVGLSANFNSLNLTQNSWGLGISNILTSTGANSNGVAQGDGVPFNNISNSMAPGLQVGYFKHIADTQNLYGFKFFYQYLGSTATNSHLYIPQLGETTSAITGVTTPLYGYVDGTSIQMTTNHEVGLIALFGRSIGNASFYVGAGPALVNIKSKNYYSIGYAVVNGENVNVTGLITYDTPSTWAWAGTAQMGASYFFTPTWFVDLAYTYTITGNTTFNHQQGFANTSQITGTTYTTSGTLVTKNTISIKNQTVMFSVNKLFDF